MKKYFLLTSLLAMFFIFGGVYNAHAETCADGSNPNIVVDANGGVTYLCPATKTSGASVTTVNGAPSGNSQAPVTTTQAPTPTVAAPAAVTSCPNGGELKNGVCNLGYTPLEPIPGITQGVNGYDLTSSGGFAKFINAIFTIMITAGALLAVLSLTLGGVQYMTASTLGNKTAGLDRAKAAIYGILIIAATYLILNTINPQLLNFNFIACAGGGCSTSTNTTGTLAAPAPNVSSMTPAQIQTAQNNGSIGNLVNTPATNNTFTFTNGSAGNTDLNSQFATWSSACTAAHGSVQSGPQQNDGGTLTMVCAQQ